MHYLETKYGFDWGAAEITRCFSDEKKGWVTLLVKTPREELQIYVTKTGKVRIHGKRGELICPNNETITIKKKPSKKNTRPKANGGYTLGQPIFLAAGKPDNEESSGQSERTLAAPIPASKLLRAEAARLDVLKHAMPDKAQGLIGGQVWAYNMAAAFLGSLGAPEKLQRYVPANG